MNKKTRTLESELYDKKGKVTPIRSRTKWINEVKKNTKFFLGLEKRTKYRILFMNCPKLLFPSDFDDF